MFHLSDDQLEEIKTIEYDWNYKHSPYRREEYLPKYNDLRKTDPVRFALEEFKEDTQIFYEEEFFDKDNVRHYIAVKKQEDVRDYLVGGRRIDYDVYVIPECHAMSRALLIAEQIGDSLRIIDFGMGVLSNKGIGTKLLEVLEKVAMDEGVTKITGFLSPADERKDGGEGRNIFYEKCGYTLINNKTHIVKKIQQPDNKKIE